MMQQRLLAPGADPGDLVERRMPDRLRSPGAVGADGEAVRLVAQPLQEIEHGIARVERERRAAGHEKSLAAGVAVGALGDADDRDVADAEFVEHSLRDAELPQPAIDQHEVGPGAAARARDLP